MTVISSEWARCCERVRKVSPLIVAVLLAVLPARSQSTVPSPSTTNKVQPSAGTGKLMVQRACGTCHEFSQFALLNFDRKDWERAVNVMVAGGAPLKKDEIPAAIDYLAREFKERSPWGYRYPAMSKLPTPSGTCPHPIRCPMMLFIRNGAA